MSELVFSYGTLQLESVQRAIFGGPIDGAADAVVGHRLGEITITDASVIAASGHAVHPMLLPTGDPADSVPGTVVPGLETLRCRLHGSEDARELAWLDQALSR